MSRNSVLYPTIIVFNNSLWFSADKNTHSHVIIFNFGIPRLFMEIVYAWFVYLYTYGYLYFYASHSLLSVKQIWVYWRICSYV